MNRHIIALSLGGAILLMGTAAWAGELTVGPGKAFPTLEHAYDAAKSGDTILVYPQPGNKPYEKTALNVNKKIYFKAVLGSDNKRIPLSGTGFNYSGANHVPRAIVQINLDGSGTIVEGFELSGARNDSFNGAGIRINAGNDVTIRNCEIHDNDDGLMSNGEVKDKTAMNQRVENCYVHGNGNRKDNGQNHNFYMGGGSITISGCEVASSVAGHNIKLRAHNARIEYCYIHDSANREFDLVDADNTAIPNSDIVLIGNVIVKSRKAENHDVIHFGREKGEHKGTLYMVNNTIITPTYPLLRITDPNAKVNMINNIISDGDGAGKGLKLLEVKSSGSVTGTNNWIAAAFTTGPGVDLRNTFTGRGGEVPPFVSAAKNDFHWSGSVTPFVNGGVTWDKITLPDMDGCPKQPAPMKLFQYKAPSGTEERPDDGRPDLGAFEFGKAAK